MRRLRYLVQVRFGRIAMPVLAKAISQPKRKLWIAAPNFFRPEIESLQVALVGVESPRCTLLTKLGDGSPEDAIRPEPVSPRPAYGFHAGDRQVHLESPDAPFAVLASTKGRTNSHLMERIAKMARDSDERDSVAVAREVSPGNVES